MKAYKASTIGKREIIEHMAQNSVALLESSLSLEKKNEFYGFAKQVVREEADKHPNDAKRQLLAGSFLVNTGFPDEALLYLERARQIMPGKQQVYFDTASAYFAKNDSATGLSFFRQAYDLAPDYTEAKVIYLLGAIYAGDGALENNLIAKFTEKQFVFEDRILQAYYGHKRFAEVIKILERRKKLDPGNAATYDEYIRQVRNQ